MSKGNKIPLKWRLKAWWEGYDIHDIEQAFFKDSQQHQQKSPKQSAFKAEQQKQLWDEAAIKVTQMVWGDGYCGPGGPENVIAMSKLLALSPEMSAAMIGASLGGPTRVLADEFGVWMTGYEQSEALAQQGMQLSIDAGLEKKAPILHIDFNEDLVFERNFDRAFAKESFYLIEQKSALIQSLYDSLKENSLFLLTDYMLPNKEALADTDIISWIKDDPIPPYPITPDIMIKLLEAAGFKIRMDEDITPLYVDLIQQAWEGAGSVIEFFSNQGEDGKAELHSILKEAEYWTRRLKLLQSGKLTLHRILAHKPSTVR